MEGSRFRISGSDARHISSVLRMVAGDSILLITGDGTEHKGIIDRSSADLVEGAIVETHSRNSEPRTRVTVIQCLPKGDKMETVIQKCVELGVHRIIPAQSSRCVVKLDPSRAENRVERWRRISKEASKQCGRSVIPLVTEVCSLPDAFALCSNADVKLIPWELEDSTSLRAALSAATGTTDLSQSDALRPKHDSVKGSGSVPGSNPWLGIGVAVCIGPEGGLASAEVELALDNGFVPVTLGPRILRTETAAMAVLACIMYHMGEFDMHPVSDAGSHRGV